MWRTEACQLAHSSRRAECTFSVPLWRSSIGRQAEATTVAAHRTFGLSVSDAPGEPTRNVLFSA